VTITAIALVISKALALIFGEILFDEFIMWVVFAFIASIAGLSIIRSVYTRKYIISRLKKGMEVYNAEGNLVGLITEVSRKEKAITVEAEKQEKAKVPFSRIVLVKEYVSARV